MSNLENNMLFPVKEVPAILQDTHLSTEHKFIVREDTEQVLSCMSNEYKLVTNQEVFEKSSEVIKEFEGTLTETKIFGNGARALSLIHISEPTRPERIT